MNKKKKTEKEFWTPKTYEYLYDEDMNRIGVIANPKFFEELVQKMMMCECMEDEEE